MCPKLKTPNSFFERNGSNNKITIGNEGFGARGPWSRFHIFGIPDSEKRRLDTTDIQSKKVKRIHQNFQIQTDKHAKNSIFCATTRLANKNRFVECIFPSTNCKSAQMFPALDLQRPGVANDLPPFWPCLFPKSFCVAHQLGRTSVEGKRRPYSSLFRRFLPCQSRPLSFTKARSRSCSTSRTIGMASELQKIGTDTAKSYRVSGHMLGPTYQQQILAGQKVQRNVPENKKDTREKDYKLKGNSKYSRLTELCQLPSYTRSSQSSCSSKTLSRPSSSSKLPICNSPRSSRRIKLVARQHFEQLDDTLPPGDSLPSNRCLGVGMGCATRQFESFGTVVPKRVCPSFEPTGNVGSIVRSTRSLPPLGKFITPDTERQQNSSVIFEKRGRHKVTSPNEYMPQSFSCVGPSQYSYRSTSSTRTIQPRSRPLVSSNSLTGMASANRDNGESISQMGNSADRFICVGDGTRGSSLRVLGRDGPSSSSERLVQPDLELRSGMGISTSIPNTTCSSPPQYSNRSLLVGSPSMAESVLEARSTKSSTGCTVHDSQLGKSPNRYGNRSASPPSPRHDPGSMEMWGWTESLKHWSQEQRDFLGSSWRESSLRTYKPAWEKWVAWSKGNAINTFNPSGSDLARFLIDLHQKHNLSYSTILVYKSAVSTLCDPNSDTRLSSHVLVKHALKAISNKKPKLNKAPIWDTDCLKTWLHSSPVNENNLYECSRRAAILLLLCSGRRVHDLSLLIIDSDSCIISENSIIFWPKFGSKTDSYTNRQSGWQLLSNKDSKALDPIFWIRRVIFLSAERRKLCKSNNLFLTACGQPKEATPTIIANWVKKVLIDAGIKASPGSIRPAVASKNWVQDCPLEEILARGNWRSQNTFNKYYCRVIKPTRPLSSTSSCFVPIT